MSNGSRIIALTANPDSARSYEGDVVLDEFAFHLDARKVYEAIEPSITRGYSLEVISTPNGQQGEYYHLAKAAGLVDDLGEPNCEWSAHKADICQAIAQGCRDRYGKPLKLETVRAGCLDDEMWLQEYCCNFLAGGSQWIPWDLFSANIEPGLVVDDNPQGTGLYAGWDIARNRDLSVVWFDQLVGDVTVTRGLLVMAKMPTPEQTELVAKIMPRIHRLCIDRTGMGIPIFETMERMFPGQVEGVTFTQQTKESMATETKRRLEKRRCRLPETVIVNGRPDDQIVWQNFRNVRKTTMTLG